MASSDVAMMEAMLAKSAAKQKDKAASKVKDKPGLSMDGKKILSGVYITGFCATGGHENTQVLSSTGALLRSCLGEYEVKSGYTWMTVTCTCPCHAQFREMRALAKETQAKERDAAFFDEMLAVTFGHGQARADVPEPAEAGSIAPLAAPNAAPATPAPAPRKPDSMLIIDLSDNFKPTPSGRAARGQLEERVRVVIAKYHVEMRDMMTPNAIRLMVDKDNPPSQGAIHAIFTRWERQAFAVLAKNPFRLVELTERGIRQLVR